MRAEWVISLCQFFHKLPSEILAEDAEMLQMMQLQALGNPGGNKGDG